MGKKPKRWGILANNRFLEHCRVLSLNLVSMGSFCSHGLVIRPWLVILTIRYNSYSMLIDFDDRTLQLICVQNLNTNHVLVSVMAHGPAPLHLPSCWRTRAFPSHFKHLNSLSRRIINPFMVFLCWISVREKNMSHYFPEVSVNSSNLYMIAIGSRSSRIFLRTIA